MVAVRNPVPARMTVDEFLCWDSGERSGRLWQLVDGEPVAMAPGSQNHGALQGEIGRLHVVVAMLLCLTQKPT